MKNVIDIKQWPFAILRRILPLLCIATITSALSIMSGVHASSDCSGDTDLLKERVNAWMQAVKDGKYDLLFDMRATSVKKGRDEKEKLKQFLDEFNRGVKIESWSIEEVERRGRVAEVRVEVSGKMRDGEAWADVRDNQISYWTYEKKNWFKLSERPTDWNDIEKK